MIDFRKIILARLEERGLTRAAMIALTRTEKNKSRHTSLAMLRRYLNGHGSISADRLEVILARLEIKVGWEK